MCGKNKNLVYSIKKQQKQKEAQLFKQNDVVYLFAFLSNLPVNILLPFHAPDLPDSRVRPEDQVLSGQVANGRGLADIGRGDQEGAVVGRDRGQALHPVVVRDGGKALHPVFRHVEQELRDGNTLGGVELADVVADTAHAPGFAYRQKSFYYSVAKTVSPGVSFFGLEPGQ